MMTLILGIETSCDETSAAVIENGERILSNIIASQIDLHALGLLAKMHHARLEQFPAVANDHELD